MLCYMDRTFCPFWEECKEGEGCSAKVPKTGEGDLPIALYVDKPSCFEDKG
jgi:hypothetical protein